MTTRAQDQQTAGTDEQEEQHEAHARNTTNQTREHIHATSKDQQTRQDQYQHRKQARRRNDRRHNHSHSSLLDHLPYHLTQQPMSKHTRNPFGFFCFWLVNPVAHQRKCTRTALFQFLCSGFIVSLKLSPERQ